MTLKNLFSAVSKPILANQFSFAAFCLNLQDNLRVFAPLQRIAIFDNLFANMLVKCDPIIKQIEATFCSGVGRFLAKSRQVLPRLSCSNFDVDIWVFDDHML